MKSLMAEFMRDDRRHLVGVHQPLAILLEEPACDVDPTVRRRQPVDRIDLVDVDADARQV